ncbi:predicted protein [Naegleria gruberi]|uniref:Predicted protein n=1 Tax=Naegleria gruberi TaxID=5762 RepID=D2VS91_NAEGR|nr:uncharacterized protein NAEGRDRAFT_71857 [Naegleria gruberi]EFC40383.1 predicted protein [Naegleria gruberi]|eukprot:XP_002673127.1 predicted protein [Naegleria gruberi strain NEG-M]
MNEYDQGKRFPYPYQDGGNANHESNKFYKITSIQCHDETFRSDPFDEFGPHTRKFVHPLVENCIEIKVPLPMSEKLIPSACYYSIYEEVDVFSKVVMAPKRSKWESASIRPPITYFLQEDRFIDDEYVVQVHTFNGFSTLFTSYGRFAFEMDSNHNIYFVDYLDEEKSEKFRVQQFVQVFAGFKLFYCISNNYLYSIERIQHEIVINKSPVKEKVSKLLALDSGIIFIQTLAGDWIFQNKVPETPFSFLKSKQDFSKLDIHLLLGLKPKTQKKKSLFNDNQLPQCIEIVGNGINFIGFLLQDYSLYISPLLFEKSKKKI